MAGTNRKETAQEEAPKQRPAAKFRYGRLTATLWRQTSDKGPWYSVVFSRGYQDQAGDWKSSSSFGRDDLLLLAKLCDQAHTWIYHQMAKDASTQAGSEPADQDDGQGEAIPF
jgi:hypothetical protein